MGQSGPKQVETLYVSCVLQKQLEHQWWELKAMNGKVGFE